MKQTKQLMQQILTPDIEQLSDKQAFELYTQTKDQRVIAKYFTSMYSTLNTIVLKCPWGAYEDRVSNILMAIMRALDTYNSEKGAALTSYIITCCKWYLYDIYKAQCQRKGRETAVVYSLDKMKEDTHNNEYEMNFLRDCLQEYSYAFEDIDFKNTLKCVGLTPLQLNICIELISDNKVMFVDVCRSLNITTNEFYKERNNIKKKLRFLLDN